MTRPLSADQWEMKRLAQQQVRLLTKIRKAQDKSNEAQAVVRALTDEYRVLEEQEQKLRGRLAGVPEPIPASTGVPPAPLETAAPVGDRESLLFERRQLVTKNAALGAHPAQVALRTERIKEIDAALVALDTPPNQG
jgi:hypothetical protein